MLIPVMVREKEMTIQMVIAAPHLRWVPWMLKVDGGMMKF
jgi:hypothetical protein